MTMKLFVWAVAALAVAFGVGWVTGASGRSEVEQARRSLEERADLAEARALVLDGRVSLFLVNFGDASRRFVEARGVLERAQRRLREVGQAERAGRVEVALSHLRDAERLTAALDQTGAQNASAEALRAIASLGS